MPERKAYEMPDGKLYLFPSDVTDDELMTFANDNFPYVEAVASHPQSIDTEVGPEAPASPVGEESGERTPPTLEPSHEKTMTQAEALKAVEIAAMTPATAPGALHAVGRGEGTDPARVLSGVSPAPPPSMGAFFEDPGPYFADIGSEIAKEGKRVVTEPLEFAKDVGTVLTAPSGGINVAAGGRSTMGPDDPLAARALERGVAQVAGFAPALLGVVADAFEKGPFVDEAGEPTEWAGLRGMFPKNQLEGDWKGLREGGNLDLNQRPDVELPDGSSASVYSMSVEIDGDEVLIPRVSEDGRLMTEVEAIDEYQKTGNHLGKFDSPEDATKYAMGLHEQQAALGKKRERPFSKKLFEASAEIAERVREIDTGARTIFDVKDPSQTSEFIVNVFAEQGPIIAGLVGATMLGGPGALIPAAAGLETGAIAQEMQMESGEVDPNAAAVGGAIAGALEAVPIMLWMNRTSFGEGATRWIASRAMSAGAQAPEEAGTEYAQTLVEALAVQWLAENRTAISDRDWEAALEIIKETQGEAVAAAATGGIAGLGFGALGGTGMSEAQARRAQERAFKKIMRMKARVEQVAAEGTREATFQAVGEAGEEAGLPPLGAPEEVVGGPRVSMFEEMAAIEAGPRVEEEPEAPPEPPGGPKKPPDGGAPPAGGAKTTEPVEPPPKPKGPLKLVETEGGFLVEGQHSAIYEIHKGGENIGMAQLRLNPDGKIVIVDHMETFGEPATVRGLLELRAQARELFPDAEFIAGQTASAEQRARGELGEWRTFPLKPKEEAPGTAVEAAPEAEAEPITQEVLDERYAQQDKLKADLEKKGAGEIVDTEGNKVSYKVVADTPEGPYWYERTIAGQREKITVDDLEHQPGPFRTLYLARLGALNDADSRIGLDIETIRKAKQTEIRIVDREEYDRINASYSGDKLGEGKPKARKAAVVDGKKYIAVGGGSRGGESETDVFEEVPIAEFIEEFGEDALVRGREGRDRQRQLLLGSYHGTVFKRGKNEYVLKGPKITFQTEGYEATKNQDDQERLIGARITTMKGKPFPHAGHGANIREYLNPEWDFNQLARGVTRILDQFELSDNDLVGLETFLDPDSGHAWAGDPTDEQTIVIHGFQRRIAEEIAKREIPGDTSPENKPAFDFIVDLDPDWTLDEFIDGITAHLDHPDITDEALLELDRFFDPTNEGSWKGQLKDTDETTRYEDIQEQLWKEMERRGLMDEEGQPPSAKSKPEPEVPAKPEPEPEEPVAPFRVGQIIWRNRDGMSAEVIRVTPKKNTEGKVVRFTIRLEFNDGHKHSFASHQVEERFSTVPKEEEVPAEPADQTRDDYRSDVYDLMNGLPEGWRNAQEVVQEFQAHHDIKKLPKGMMEGITNALEELVSSGKIQSRVSRGGGVSMMEFSALEVETKPAPKAKPKKKGAAKPEVVEAVVDVVTSSALEHTYGDIYIRVKLKLGKATDAQVTKAIDQAVAEGAIEESTETYRGQEEPIYRRPPGREPVVKETKTAEKVIEATPEEAQAVINAPGEPQADGFTSAQRKWFINAVKGAGKLVDPAEPGPAKYALEVRVPGDGTFFLTAEGAPEFLEVVKRKRSPTSRITRIKYRPPATKHKELPYKAAGGWEGARATEKKGVYTDGHGMILKLSPDATARIKKRINDIDPDVPKVPKDSIDRVIKDARKSQDIIRVRGVVWPNPHGPKVNGEWGVELETEDGTRVNHFTLSWDKMKFMEEATGATTMKADLKDDKTFSPVGFYKGRELVGILMPAQNVNYRAGEPQPAVEEAEEPPLGDTKASLGRYRAFAQENGPNGPKGQALAPNAPPQLRVLPLGMPELVRLARALGRGRYPRIRRLLLRNPGVLGYFRPKPRSAEGITLKASIFKEPEQAAATLAHEIGHWIDFLPDRTFSRGNLLGRIAGLVRYMKHTISMFPDQPGEITPEDRSRLRKEAKELSREEYWEEVEEVIRKEFGVTVEDVLNIWRQYVPDVPKDLHDYIKKLSAEQKISIAKQAMKGLLAPELDRFKRVVEEKTGKVRRVKKVRYIDAEKKFQELLAEEIRKRHLVTIEEIRDEMWLLSVGWRPLPPDPTRAHLAYRKKGEEIYADAISALLNDPDYFQRIAPKSFSMMMAYLQKNPAMWSDYQQLQQLAQDPEGLKDERLSEYQRMVKEGSIARGEQMKDRLGIGEGWKNKVTDLGTALASGMIDTNAAWYRLRRKARKNPDITWLEENDPIHNIEELAYANARYAYYLDRWQAEVQNVIGDLLTDNDFGVLLGLRRAGRSKGRGGREELANPLGIGGKDARELISHLLKKKKITREKAEVIVEALRNWQEIRMEIFDEIEKAGMLSPELLGVLRKSVGSYATFKVRKYIEDPDPAVNAALGNIARQIGTFSEIGNPVIETILKDLALARAAHRTQTIKYMIDQLVEAEEGAVIPAFPKKVRGINVGFPAPPDGMELVSYLEKGNVKGVYMNEEYAKALNHRESTATYQYYRMATGLVRGVMVTHNPMWAIWNLQRDFRAMVVNATPANAVVAPFMALKWVLKAAPEAFRDVSRNGLTMRTLASLYKAATGKELNTEALTVREMMKDSALIQSGMRFYKAADILDEEASALLFQFYGLTEAHHRTLVRNVIGHLGAILSNPGQFSERVIKIAGYKMLKAHQADLRLTDKEISHLVRSRVGTPDIMRRGDYHNFTNSVFLFSNVAKEGYRAAWEALEEDPVRYSSKTILYDVLPTVVKWLAASGVFGTAVKALYDRIPEYHKRTYTVIPIGLTTSGKAVYMIFPHDHVGQLLVSATWAALERDKSLQQEIAWEAAQNLPWSHGSIHPYLESAIQWALYASGINPQDWFRGRSAVPEKVWEAGDQKRTRQYMAASTWDNIGGRILTDFAGLGMEDQNGDVDPEGIADWIEKGSGWPVAGSFIKRFIRVSDRGVSETGFDTLRDMRQPKKLATLERDETIMEILKVNPEADGWAVWDEMDRRGQDPAYTYKNERELVKKLNKRTDTLRLRVHGSVLDRLWSYAVTDEEREAIDALQQELRGE